MNTLTVSVTAVWHRVHRLRRLAQPRQQTRCPHGINTTATSSSRQTLHCFIALRRLFSISTSHASLSESPPPPAAATKIVYQPGSAGLDPPGEFTLQRYSDSILHGWSEGLLCGAERRDGKEGKWGRGYLPNKNPGYGPDLETTRMWANAQRDGRPAEHRWRPLFNAAKFSWCPLLDAVQ